MSASARLGVSGRAIVLHGDDIDTDRIMPARFLRAITFEGIETHVFEDDRKSLAVGGGRHPFDDPDRRSANVLFVGANFGCGSSREHAPQGILRWGIRAIVGESFAEIFFGNAVAIGLPCVTVAPDELAKLVHGAEADPTAIFAVDLVTRTVSGFGLTVRAQLPESAREALVTGQWDATALLLERYHEVEQVASALPYVNHFRG